ncbi:ion transporter [Apilactobacillus xinyiensis]|uniref:ion transporter n=1 Tax=Apilactobacillus xinyiensis TaxID=2841032 RepID=UPI00200BEBD6|nr:ion transporter [Apilactobacillus xinyiensis]MCL0319470.1 ion transporter [Apilactobacillus xinyiensis]
MKFKNIYKLYIIIISLLAVISISIFVLDFFNKISISESPWSYVDRSILIIFTIDYFSRLTLAKNKWSFFKRNIFDLLAIIPFDSIFSLFRIVRISRLFRLFKLLRIFRFIGVLGKFQKNVKKFLNTNGLIWTLLASIILIIVVASMFYSLAENVNFGEAIWWSITTTTTVGYGDISPQTPLGKFAAIILMFTGIGIIGILTSAITS